MIKNIVQVNIFDINTRYYLEHKSSQTFAIFQVSSNILPPKSSHGKVKWMKTIV